MLASSEKNPADSNPTGSAAPTVCRFPHAGNAQGKLNNIVTPINRATRPSNLQTMCLFMAKKQGAESFGEGVEDEAARSFGVR